MFLIVEYYNVPDRGFITRKEACIYHVKTSTLGLRSFQPTIDVYCQL